MATIGELNARIVALREALRIVTQSDLLEVAVAVAQDALEVDNKRVEQHFDPGED